MRLIMVVLTLLVAACAPAVLAQENSGADVPAATPSATDWLSEIQPPTHGGVVPCRRLTDGFDRPVLNPCRPAQLQPVLPGFVTAELIALPATTSGQSYMKPPFPSGGPLNCPGLPSECLGSVLNQVPSPIGETMFANMTMATDGTGTLELDESAVYAYSCPTGRCEGYAWQVWEALPSAQKETYLSALFDAIAAWRPDLISMTLTVKRWTPRLNLDSTLAKRDAGQTLFAPGQPFKSIPVAVPWAAHLP